MNCYQAKAGELAKQWYVIDATDMVVGRLAAQIAPILMGKHRPTYTPHIDTGDYVIVTNVDKVVFTGNKWQQKFYQRYTGHPGGQKDEQAWKLFKRRPERILQLAIQRMMPKNKIGRHMLTKLKLVRRHDSTRTRRSRRSRSRRSRAAPCRPVRVRRRQPKTPRADGARVAAAERRAEPPAADARAGRPPPLDAEPGRPNDPEQAPATE